MLAQLGVPSLISCIGNISALINTQDWQYFKHLVLIVRRWAWSLFCVNVWRNHAEKPSAESRQIQTNLYVAMLQRWQSEEPVYCLNISDSSDLNAVHVKLIFPSVLLCRVGNNGRNAGEERRSGWATTKHCCQCEDALTLRSIGSSWKYLSIAQDLLMIFLLLDAYIISTLIPHLTGDWWD